MSDEPEIPEVLQPEDMDDEQREFVRQAALHEFQTCIALRDLVVKEAVTSIRWVQTSLLVVNAGGAIALLDTDIDPSAKAWAGGFFVAGITLSLLTALAGVSMMKDVPGRLTRLAGYWLSVTVDLLRSEEIEREWHSYTAQLTKRGRLSYAIGFASLAAFFGGCLLIAQSVV